MKRTCDFSLIGHLVDGSITPAERAQLDRHLARCPLCMRELFWAERADAHYHALWTEGREGDQRVLRNVPRERF